jgi:SnoaL-like domain
MIQVEESAVATLKKAYREFNARNLNAVLELMQPGVEWPNGMEGGTVHGHAGVRDYWTRQWAMINPQVNPLSFDVDESERTIVTVHQVVRDLSGKLLLDRQVKHVYTVKDGLIQSMEIQE